jgi:hypothetical protein
VPLIFAFPGGSLNFIQQSASEAQRVSPQPGDLTNADLTPIILEVLDKTREQKP